MDKPTHLELAKKSIENTGFDGGRPLKMLEEALGFSRKDLENKIVLDLGAGYKDTLATQLKNEKVDVKVISLTPAYAEKKWRDQALNENPEGMYVAALGENLPLKDECIDVVISHEVVMYLPNREAFLKFCSEVVRVLKKGGQAYVGFIYNYNDYLIERFPGHGFYSMKLEPNDLEPFKVNIQYEDCGKRGIKDPTENKVTTTFGRYKIQKL